MDAPRAAYNLILGRPSLNELGAIVSTPHLTMKFHSSIGEVISTRADQKEARQCYVDSLKVNFKEEEKATEKERETDEKQKGKMQVASVGTVELDPRVDMKELRLQPADDLKKFRVGKKEWQDTHIGTQLEADVEEAIIRVVMENFDLFAWCTVDMPGVDPKVVCHKLYAREPSLSHKRKERWGKRGGR